ncbi:hypothetical protein AHAS_Ahas07G0056500 [Arachis hypogaea]
MRLIFQKRRPDPRDSSPSVPYRTFVAHPPSALNRNTVGHPSAAPHQTTVAHPSSAATRPPFHPLERPSSVAGRTQCGCPLFPSWVSLLQPQNTERRP